MTSLGLLAFLFLVFISAFTSASEIALFSLTRFQIKSLKDEFRATHRKIKRLLSDPAGLLVTILVINEVVNIAITSLITEAVSLNNFHMPDLFSNIQRWKINIILGVLITSPVILLLCEITPKVIAARLNRVITLLAIGPLTLFYDLLKPIRIVLKFIIDLTSKVMRSRETTKEYNNRMQGKTNVLRESEFLMMVEEGHKEGAIAQNELDLIKNVFELDDTTTSEISTPLSQVLSFPVNTTLKTALAAIKSQRYSRIPILGNNQNEVVGILYSKDLLRAKLQSDISNQTVADIMRKPIFVRSNLRLNSLFRKFKLQKIHMAVVRDSNDGVIGVVTMSDILDALFEDLFLEEEFSIHRDASRRTLP